MIALAIVIAAAPVVMALYAYVIYPAVLWAVARRNHQHDHAADDNNWPVVTVTIPVYNAAHSIRTTLMRLLELDYPKVRLQLLVLSDASNDGTDDVVRKFAARGIELMRAPTRRGKSAGENAAVAMYVVCTVLPSPTRTVRSPR